MAREGATGVTEGATGVTEGDATVVARGGAAAVAEEEGEEGEEGLHPGNAHITKAMSKPRITIKRILSITIYVIRFAVSAAAIFAS